jgi:VWFA-related protein
MMNSWLAVAAALTVLAPQAPAQSARPQREARDRTIYVAALDAKGAPVTGLTATDFAVREDGVAREVLKAAPATAPMQVMLVVDDSEAITPMVSEFRDALHAFVNALAGKAQIGLVTFGERPTSVAPLAMDPAPVTKAIDRLFARPHSGAYLTDAIYDVATGMTKRKDDRPVIVVVTAEGVQYANVLHDRALKQLEASHSTLHVVAIGTPNLEMDHDTRERNLLIADGTEQTGGRREQLVTQLGLKDRMLQLASDLTNQYELTYARPESLIPPEKIQVTSTRPGVTVRARTRLAEQ